MEGQFCDRRSGTDIFGKCKGNGFFLFVLKKTALRNLERKAARIDLDGMREAIFEAATFGGELERSRAVRGDHTGRKEEGFALFGPQGDEGRSGIFE